MNIFFDLDGTLTDPAEGITRGLEYAVTGLGSECPPREELERFIGPPLKESLRRLLPGSDEQELLRAVGLYRERFTSAGMYENRVFDDIPPLLTELTTRGDPLWVVTSKPREYAGRILEHFDLHRCFVDIYGPQLSDHAITKGELIGQLLSDHALEPDRCVMIGDRHYDAAGAAEQGIHFIGVLWGFGSYAELADAGAGHIASSPVEVGAIVREVERITPGTGIRGVRPAASESLLQPE
ncbi:MAG: HAD hydrolase-like protein [Spirochaetia bacterium]